MIISRFPPTLGGAEIQCLRLSTWLAQNGHTIVVLTEKSQASQPDREMVNGFEVIRFQTVGGLPWSSYQYGLKALRYLRKSEKFDILHAHMIATPAIVAYLAARKMKSPFLVKVTGARGTGDFGTSRKYTLGHIKLAIFKSGNPFVVCPSTETFSEARAFGISPDRLFVIPNGVDTQRFEPASKPKADLRTSLKLPLDGPLALYVGRWAKGKGVESLLDVWESGTSQSHFPWHLLMVLSEPPPRSIATRIEKLNGKVHTAIGVTDPLTYYQASDLAVLLSEGEGLSNFLLEAGSCGLPSLTTEAAALPNAEGEATGTCTLLKGNPLVSEALVFLNDAAKQMDRLADFGKAARRHTAQHYSFDTIGRAYVELYRRMSPQ